MKKLSLALLLALSSTVCLAHNAHAKQATAVHESSQIQLASVSAAVVDARTGKSLYHKNADVVVPIASITKLMTAIVILDGGQPLNERIRFTPRDRDLAYHYYSRIRNDSELSRGDLIRIMLMSSENLAATALATSYPGGFEAFVKAMNAKAKALGMHHTHFIDACGLSPKNVSTASDLTHLVRAAARYRQIRDATTTAVYTANFHRPRYRVGYTNTNPLVRTGKWNISVSKTGYLDEAGHCLVMLTEVDNRKLVMVMLDSFGKRSPVGDAHRIRRWLSTGNSGTIAGAARDYERRKTAELSDR